jgi:hypothetical protein
MDRLHYTKILSTSLKSSSSSGSSAPTRNVSVASVTKGNTIDNRYYSPAEYAKLTAWAKHGHVKGAKESKVLPSQATKKQKTEGKESIAALKK